MTKRKRHRTDVEEAISSDKITPERIGLDPALYAAALRYLFDRRVPEGNAPEWFWNIDEPAFEARSLEWTRIQTVLFANAAQHLAPFTDEQVGLGLNYLMSNSVSEVPFAAIEPEVPLAEAMQMMYAMPSLWRDCIGPRLASIHAPIGEGAAGSLGFVCYMWFDIWPSFWSMRHLAPWRDAMWHVLEEMLKVPCREVQIAALHGIGHNGAELDRREAIDHAIDAFLAGIGETDDELRTYALAARRGCVQ